jgi:dienelactone hydrolase
MSGWLVRRGTFSILACALLALTLFAVAVVAFGCGGAKPTSSTSVGSTAGSTTESTPSSDTSAGPASLPNTPVGRQAAWFLAAAAHPPIPEADVRAHFASVFLAQVSPAMLNQTLAGATNVKLISIQSSDSSSLVTIVSTAGPQVAVSVHVDAQGLIDGLHIGPVTPPTTVPYTPPSYADQNAFIERSVTVGAGTQWALPGTLTLPKGAGPFPVVVLVQGSGPNDRNEMIGPNRPFQDLAWGLASHGIAVLRYDKRTFVYPQQTQAESATFTVQQESIDDALQAAKLLRSRSEIDSKRIYVLGHSLGGTVAPRIGQQDPSLAGLIILAGATRPLEDIILDQETYLASLDGGPTPAQTEALKGLKVQIARVKDPNLSSSTPAGELPLDVPAAYWLGLRGYEPATTAAGLQMRLLVLQGGRDYQVTTVDYAGWQAALSGHANAKMILYPDLNHLFQTGVGKSIPSEYEKPGHVAEKVITDIAGWVNE